MAKKKKTQTLTCRLTVEESDTLRLLAKVAGKPMSFFARIALREFTWFVLTGKMRTEAQKWPRLLRENLIENIIRYMAKRQFENYTDPEMDNLFKTDPLLQAIQEMIFTEWTIEEVDRVAADKAGERKPRRRTPTETAKRFTKRMENKFLKEQGTGE